jgi:hypothetical protein
MDEESIKCIVGGEKIPEKPETLSVINYAQPSAFLPSKIIIIEPLCAGIEMLVEKNEKNI